jgi:hypothetical protein
MGLKDVLSKMKLVEIEPDDSSPESTPEGGPPSGIGGVGGAPSGPGRMPGSPSPVLADLLGSLPEPPKIDESKLPPQTGEGADIPSFAQIYKVAGVTDPPHGYTAYKVLDIFSSPGFATLDLRAKAAALTGFLNMNPSGPVPVTDIVQDAVKRDQALDKFEDFLRGKLGARGEQAEKENAALQKEIDELTRRNKEKMEANRCALEVEQARFTRWQVEKRAEERKLFEAVNPFVESNPITTTDSPRAAASAAAPGK